MAGTYEFRFSALDRPTLELTEMSDAQAIQRAVDEAELDKVVWAGMRTDALRDEAEAATEVVAGFLPWQTSDMLVSPHLSIAGARGGRVVTKPDSSLLDDVVASKVLDAMKAASSALTRLGIRHVVVGGLAVGANGSPRATKDVDFLVGDEAFEQHPGGFVTMKPGVPIQINGVAIDLLSIQAGEEHLATALQAPMGSMIEAPQLVYLKLKSPRQKDRVDVIELVKAGIAIDLCRAYLTKYAPTLAALFEESVVRAAAEE